MERLKELREKKGISLLALSKIISVSDGQLGKYEKGLSEPRQDVRQELADYFGVSVPYLMGHDEQREYKSLEEIKPILYDVVKREIEFLTTDPNARGGISKMYISALQMVLLAEETEKRGNSDDAEKFSKLVDYFDKFWRECLNEKPLINVYPDLTLETLNELEHEHLEKTLKKWSK